jgi:hypothetical protein
MIYIASTSAPELQAGPGNYFEGVLAHEFQHMIHNNVSPDRDAWVDEGCSEVAMALNGYDTGGGEEAAMTSPDTQLDAWADTPQIEHYGISYLFIRYLMQRFGGPTFLHALLASPGAGIAAFEDALGKLGAKQSFQAIFTDWIAANYIDDPKVGDHPPIIDAGREVRSHVHVPVIRATLKSATKQVANCFVFNRVRDGRLDGWHCVFSLLNRRLPHH